MGQPFADLLHVEDRETLQSFLDMSDPFWHSGVQHTFVVRMKTTMASTVRSQAKVQYKVCVRMCVHLYVCSNALLFVTLCPHVMSVAECEYYLSCEDLWQLGWANLHSGSFALPH